MLAMFSTNEQYPLGVAGLATGIKHKGRNIHVGDTVVYKAKNNTLARGVVLISGSKVVVEGTVGKLLSECELMGVAKSYKELGNGDLSESKGIIFLKLSV